MSDLVKPFDLCEFSDSPGTDCGEFITFFGGTGKAEQEIPEPPEPARDIEEEARRIFEDAFVQGERAGREMGMKRADPLIKRLNAYLSGFETFREELLERCERLSIDLALLFAETVTRRECEERRETVVEMAKRAMELCEEKTNITIRVRREDVQHMAGGTLSHLQVIPDDALKEPGFVIETEFGEIDGTLSVQFTELRKEFLNE